MKITRDIILDLWPPYVSGEASVATRALVEEFLASDPEFARALEKPATLAAEPLPPLPPGHEVRTLELVKRRLRGYPWLFKAAVFASALAFGRIVSDTTFDVSPRRFIIHSIVAAVLWGVYLFTLFHGRKVVMIRLK